MARIDLRLKGPMPSLAEIPADFLLTVEECAAYLGVAPSTAEKWRLGYRGASGGPPWISLHDGPKAPIRYFAGDVRKWLDARRRTGPSERTDTPAQAA